MKWITLGLVGSFQTQSQLGKGGVVEKFLESKYADLLVKRPSGEWFQKVESGASPNQDGVIV